MSLNKAMLIGNLTADPELRHTQSGAAVCEMRMATNERRKFGDEWKDHAEYHRVVVWSKRAENCAKYLSNGSKVYVEGRLSTRAWEDKDGNKRYTTEIVADDVQFLDSKKDGGSRSNHSESLPGYDRDDPMDRGGNAQREGLDDDIPF